jgi:hypothetical protein
MKSRPSLFEAINKAPQTHGPARRGGPSWLRRRSDGTSSPVVAEAMTEEEAAAELAARKEAAEADARAKAAKQQARLERKAAKQAARQAAREAAARLDAIGGGPMSEPRMFQLTQGRLVLSLNTAGCIVAAACVCLVALGSYGLGSRSASGGSVAELAAKVGGDRAADAGGLLPPSNAGLGRGRVEPAAHQGDPDLSELLKSPSERSAAVKPNQPASVGATSASGGLSEALNYLEVQFFQITRDMSSEDLIKDLADVRRFLAEHGVQTVARRHPKGFLLFATQGYPMSADAKKARQAFVDRIESLGRTYRRDGGRYSFKGCYFVSHARATSGKPL